MATGRLAVVLTCVLLSALTGACGDKHAPPAPTQTVRQVEVAVANDAGSMLAPGQTRQLFARATEANGSMIDVTNLATWQ